MSPGLCGKDWRSHWTIDGEEGIVTHSAGWVFKFAPADPKEDGVFEGRCLREPFPLTEKQLEEAPRFARTACDVWVTSCLGVF